MLIKGKIKNIDYNEIADILLQQKFAKQDKNAFMMNFIKLIIGGMKLMPKSIRDVAVIKLFTIYSENIVGMINKQISDHEIDLKIKYLTLDGTDKNFSMLHVSCQIDKQNKELQDAVLNIKKGQPVIVYGHIKDVGDIMGYTLKLDKIEVNN